MRLVHLQLLYSCTVKAVWVLSNVDLPHRCLQNDAQKSILLLLFTRYSVVRMLFGPSLHLMIVEGVVGGGGGAMPSATQSAVKPRFVFAVYLVIATANTSNCHHMTSHHCNILSCLNQYADALTFHDPL